MEQFIHKLRAEGNTSCSRNYKYVYTFDKIFEKFIDFPLDEATYERMEMVMTSKKRAKVEAPDKLKRFLPKPVFKVDIETPEENEKAIKEEHHEKYGQDVEKVSDEDSE